MVVTPPVMNFTRHSHCSWCGTMFAEQRLWPRKCFRCGNDTYLNPVPVTVAMIPVWGRNGIYQQPGVLIQKRNIEPKKGQWALPGGYMNMEETWQAGCAREVLEEIGLDTKPADYELFGVDLATNGNLLIFGVHKTIVEWEDIKFVPNEETEEILLVYTPMELAFPTHTVNLATYLSQL